MAVLLPSSYGSKGSLFLHVVAFVTL